MRRRATCQIQYQQRHRRSTHTRTEVTHTHMHHCAERVSSGGLRWRTPQVVVVSSDARAAPERVTRRERHSACRLVSTACEGSCTRAQGRPGRGRRRVVRAIQFAASQRVGVRVLVRACHAARLAEARLAGAALAVEVAEDAAGAQRRRLLVERAAVDIAALHVALLRVAGAALALELGGVVVRAKQPEATPDVLRAQRPPRTTSPNRRA